MSRGLAPDLDRLAELARAEATLGDMGIDLDAYKRANRDPLEPLIGGGALEAAIGFFGRDPGRDEVTYMEPLIGAAGQLVSAASNGFAMYAALKTIIGFAYGGAGIVAFTLATELLPPAWRAGLTAGPFPLR